MLSLKITKKKIPDLSEFTDSDGKKWIQTSTDDLFSSNELNKILDRIEKDKDSDDIVLARIDFQKVNKEYYETVVNLQAKLTKQNEILKKLLVDAKYTIDKKNKKLNELVKYIRKLHLILAYFKTKPEDMEKIIPSPDAFVYEPVIEAKKEFDEVTEEVIEKILIGYTDVEEILLDEKGNEKGPA